jgi:Holliday junction DNA helicase RuvA
MLEYISGTVVKIDKGIVVLDIQNIGIQLKVPQSTSNALQVNAKAKFFTALSLKNEEIQLYGFSSLEERAMFEKLQTVSGVGPSLSLNILSSLSLPSLYEAIVKEELSVFKGIKGVGTKTAQRIVLELKGSLPKEFSSLAIPNLKISLQASARDALLALGYSAEQANHVLSEVMNQRPEISSLDQLVREALGKI